MTDVPDDLVSRVHGGLLGIAVGDALGMPADVHRTVRSPWVRERLWSATAELDARRVARPLIPFVLDALESRRLVATDDTETAVLALRALLDSSSLVSSDLYAHWRRHASGEDVWGGVAERSAARNASHGLLPPATGTDHPADSSDSAAPAGLALGLALAGQPRTAVQIARDWGSITHSADGLDAAAMTASLAADLAANEAFDAAYSRASEQVSDGSWLAAGLRRIEDVTMDSPQQFLRHLPDLLATLSPRTYSAGSIAPETLPLAVAVVRATHRQPELGVPLAMAFPRHSDSLPAMVGGFLGAIHGSDLYAPTWGDQLDILEGIFHPTLAGQTLLGVAREIGAWRAHRDACGGPHG